VRKGSNRYPFQEGDIFLVRTTGKEYGVRGIWVFRRQERVKEETEVPWDGAEYDLILHFEPLILEFAQEFSEEFTGKSKYSEKVKINALRIAGSVIRLSNSEIKVYVEAILKEKKDELGQKAEYLGKKIVISEFLKEMVSDAKKTREKKIEKNQRLLYAIEDLVGDPINFRGMVYAPMNEAGVILLFSKIMDDLGIFYESSPSKGIDMIGRMRTEKGLKRIFIEFEFNSKNFVTHKHDPKLCDLIVCWEHDWKDCPLEVFSLKDIISTLTP
jgi:hypothetical protein